MVRPEASVSRASLSISRRFSYAFVDADGEVRFARGHRHGAGPHVRRDLLAQHRAGIDLLGKEAPDNLQGQRRISSRRPRQRLGLNGFAHGGQDARALAGGQAR